MEERAVVKWWKIPLKYFLHGLLFWGLFLALVFVWALILGVLVILGAFIGLLIGFTILMFIVGGLNSFLTDALWFPVETSWKSLLVHGFALFIVLLIVDVILFVVYARVIPSIADWIVSFVTTPFVNGYVAKNVAKLWREAEDTEERRVSEPFFRRPAEPFIRLP